MGREIRRVPPNWEHPRYTKETARMERDIGEHMPMYDKTYAEAASEWKEGFAAWARGERPDYCTEESTKLEYWEWDGAPPERAYYRPEWPEGSATWLQVYQTVSEGTPVTPPFATREGLVEYLMAHGDFWDQKRGRGGYTRAQAEAFVKDEFAPSMIVTGGKIYSGIESSSAPR